MKIPLKIGGFL